MSSAPARTALVRSMDELPVGRAEGTPHRSERGPTMTELLDVFDAIPRVPDYALDDRWRRAQTRDFKRLSLSRFIDGWMERARWIGENWHRLAEERDGRGGHGDIDDDIYAAYRLWQGPVLMRSRVEARILA